MKLTWIILSVILIASSCLAYEHPAEEAEAKLEQARKDFSIAKKRLDEAVSAISDPQKKKDATDSLVRMGKEWSVLSANLIHFRIASSPAPNTSTSSSLIPYYTEAEILNHQAKLYLDLAEWIEVNWKK